MLYLISTSISEMDENLLSLMQQQLYWEEELYTQHLFYPIYSTFIILPKASRVWQVLICCCWLALDAGYRGEVLTTMVMRRRLLYSRNWFEVPKEASNHIVVLGFEKYKRNINFLWLLFLLEKCNSASSLFVE